MPEADRYWVSSAGREFGPTDLAGLMQWVREGRLTTDTLVRKNDAPPVPAGTLGELADALQVPRGHAPVLTIPLPAEFRVWELIGAAWTALKPHWLAMSVMCLLFGILTSVLGVPANIRNTQYLMQHGLQGGHPPFGFPDALNLLQLFLNLVLMGAFLVGIFRAALGMLSGTPPSVGMLFRGFDRIGQGILASLVLYLLTMLGCCFCIIPGVILTLMWMFTFPVMAEGSRDFWQCMQESARLTKGYRGQLLLLCLAFIPILLLGYLTCCLGVFVANALIFTTLALTYRFLQARQGPAA